jgi:hypothetical protein
MAIYALDDERKPENSLEFGVADAGWEVERNSIFSINGCDCGCTL